MNTERGIACKAGVSSGPSVASRSAIERGEHLHLITDKCLLIPLGVCYFGDQFGREITGMSKAAKAVSRFVSMTQTNVAVIPSEEKRARRRSSSH
jgi:hypothetical protein